MSITQETMNSNARFILEQDGQHFNRQLFLKQNIKDVTMANIAVSFWKFFTTFSKIMFFFIVALNVTGLSLTSYQFFLYKNYLIILFYLAGLIVFTVVGLPLMVISKILQRRKKQRQLKQKLQRIMNDESNTICLLCIQELFVDQENIAIFPRMKQIFDVYCAYRQLKQSKDCPQCLKQIKNQQDDGI